MIHTEHKKKPVVCWKNETGSEGAVTVFNDPELVGKMYPFGKPPEGVESWGWMTKSKARALAMDLNADFREV